MGILEHGKTFKHTVCDFGAEKITYDCEVSLYYKGEYYGVKDFPVTYDFALAREGEVGNNIFGSVIIREDDTGYTAHARTKELALITQCFDETIVFSYDIGNGHVKINKLAPEWMKLAAAIAFFYAWAPKYYSLEDTKNFNTWMKEWNAAACLGQKIPSSRLRTTISPS